MKKEMSTKNTQGNFREFKYFVNKQFVGYKLVNMDEIFPKPKYGRY